MLCEQCQEREATVHVAAVSWPSGELTNHFCECCYPAVEAGKSYSSQPATPLPIGVEKITASEYLEACARAGANGADKPTLKHIHKELERFPATQERLAIEFLTIALQCLAGGEDPWHLISTGALVRPLGRFDETAGIHPTVGGHHFPVRRAHDQIIRTAL